MQILKNGNIKISDGVTLLTQRYQTTSNNAPYENRDTPLGCVYCDDNTLSKNTILKSKTILYYDQYKDLKPNELCGKTLSNNYRKQRSLFVKNDNTSDKDLFDQINHHARLFNESVLNHMYSKIKNNEQYYNGDSITIVLPNIVQVLTKTDVDGLYKDELFNEESYFLNKENYKSEYRFITKNFFEFLKNEPGTTKLYNKNIISNADTGLIKEFYNFVENNQNIFEKTLNNKPRTNHISTCDKNTNNYSSLINRFDLNNDLEKDNSLNK